MHSFDAAKNVAGDTKADSGTIRALCGEEMHYGHPSRESQELLRDLLGAGNAGADEDVSQT